MMQPRIDTLVELLQERSEREAGVGYTFLADGEHESAHLSYRELDAAARHLGAALGARIGPGSRVILAYPPGLEFIVGFFGCLYASIVAVPVCLPHPRKGHDRLAGIVADCGAEHVMTTAVGARALAGARANDASLPHLDVIVTDRPPEHGSSDARARPGTSARTIAFLQYTSGSTRAPRGVQVSHGNVLANLAAIHAAEGNDGTSRAVSWLPAYHDMGLIEGILQPLYGGFPTWLMPHTAFLQRPGRWLQAISRHGATVSGGPNFAFDACARRVPEAELAGLDLSRWQVAYCGAEPVRAQTLRAFANRFERCGFKVSALRPVYGLAEATLLVSASNRHSSGPQVAHADRNALECGRFVAASPGEPAAEVVSCGAPGSGVGVVIVDPHTHARLPEGCVGEIWVSGESVCAGYHGCAPGATETFRDTAIGAIRAHWLSTGDLGFMLDGELYVTGRSKDLIILHGRKLHPQDIEHTVQRLGEPPLAAVAAFALECAEEEGVVVLAELAGAHRAAGAAAHICQSHADTIRTEVFRQHDVSIAALAFLPPGALARTSSGKLMRFRCKQDFVNAQLPFIARFDAPRRGAGRVA